MNSSQENSNQGENVHPPELRFHDQTPITRQDPKRKHLSLSPCVEESEEISTIVQKAVNDSLRKIIPEITESLKDTLQTIISEMISKAIEPVKTTIMSAVEQNMKDLELKMSLKAMSEAEQLESYNRRENIRVIGLSEPPQIQNSDGRLREAEDIPTKILEISNECKAAISLQDISIAHRLPSKKAGAKPVIVRFARRSARIDLLRK